MSKTPASGALALRHNELFRPGGDWQLNACVGQNGGPYTFHDYANGFFEAGERIFQTLNVEHPFKLDVLVYPIAFCYRQGIELYVKHLLIEHGKLLPSTRFVPSHNLQAN